MSTATTGRPAALMARDHRRGLAADVAREPDAEERIDDHVGVERLPADQGSQRAARRDEIVVRAARIAVSARGSAERDDRHAHEPCARASRATT